jgi:hypothetical protein
MNDIIQLKEKAGSSAVKLFSEGQFSDNLKITGVFFLLPV